MNFRMFESSSQNSHRISKGDVFRYVALPQVIPRMRELFGSGLQYVPYFIALVYQSVKLLPQNHPYTHANNIGQYGIRHVVAEAANSLVFDRNHIDQILLFTMSLVGLILLFGQVALLVFGFVFSPAVAAVPTGFAGFFQLKEPAHDLAYIMMDIVFGVPDVFKSCVSTATQCRDVEGNALVLPPEYGGVNKFIGPLAPNAHEYFPFPIHQGLQQMFQFYSMGLLVVASMLTTYFVITILLETAQTGTAFGKRFNKVWAPIRIVVAFGLLVPIGYGMNASQYIVLYAAKYGSAFASNGWNLFNETLTNETYLNQMGELVSAPQTPDIGFLLQFYDVARTCFEFEKIERERDTVKLRQGHRHDVRPEVKPYLVRGPLNGSPNLVVEDVGSVTYEELVQFANGDNRVTLVFGQTKKGDDAYSVYQGFVRPTCGKITIDLADARPPGSGEEGPEKGPEILQRYYWFILKELWFRQGPVISNHPNFPEFYALYGDSYEAEGEEINNRSDEFKGYVKALWEFYDDDLQAALFNPGATGLTPFVKSNEGAIEAAQDSGSWFVPPELQDKGWIGAAIWYNRIAELNGAVTTAVFNIPQPAAYPQVMEEALDIKRSYNEQIDFNTRFRPRIKENESLNLTPAIKQKMAEHYYAIFSVWQESDALTGDKVVQTGNLLIDAINAVFGTKALFDMRANADAHPLAQLVGVGRALVESSIRNIGGAFAGGATALVSSTANKLVGSIVADLAGFLITFAMVGLTVGFVLFYIVPFLPFIYFFFAACGWVKGIFEAMVGAPLWALAHIRIDGEGLPGPGAKNGYFLIFEIGIRPILTLFGLIASILTFSALVKVLNITFDLVISNLTGNPLSSENATGILNIDTYRGPVDQFFFTIVYAILVYLMGMSSFKLVDLVPNNILRWMGESVSSFNDDRQDPAQNLVGTASIGAQQTLSNLGGGLQGLVKLGKS